ncbi:TPA: hypothetical protein EYO12_04010 [Candidatus Saccharibacteria bacterium]|nr:hypothetical protein [Candidatus Saccharibacteria bacterium]HIO87800.1 hypothetical protein [Candidatus Saccharibacteria bacterium]
MTSPESPKPTVEERALQAFKESVERMARETLSGAEEHTSEAVAYYKHPDRTDGERVAFALGSLVGSYVEALRFASLVDADIGASLL